MHSRESRAHGLRPLSHGGPWRPHPELGVTGSSHSGAARGLCPYSGPTPPSSCLPLQGSGVGPVPRDRWRAPPSPLGPRVSWTIVHNPSSPSPQRQARLSVLELSVRCIFSPPGCRRELDWPRPKHVPDPPKHLLAAAVACVPRAGRGRGGGVRVHGLYIGALFRRGAAIIPRDSCAAGEGVGGRSIVGGCGPGAGVACAQGAAKVLWGRRRGQFSV